MSAAENPLKILRFGRDHMEQFEEEAEAAVIAGDLVELTATGIQPCQATHAQLFDPLIAMDPRGVGGEAGFPYEVGDNVFVMRPHGGSLWMRLGAGFAVTRTDLLVSNANNTPGTVRPIEQDGTDPDDPDSAAIGVPGEAVDNSGGSSPMWVPVEF